MVHREEQRHRGLVVTAWLDAVQDGVHQRLHALRRQPCVNTTHNVRYVASEAGGATCGGSAPPAAMLSPPPGLADTTTCVQPAKRVAAKVAVSRFCSFASVASYESEGSRSALLSTTMSFVVVSSPMTRHSAVCV